MIKDRPKGVFSPLGDDKIDLAIIAFDKFWRLSLILIGNLEVSDIDNVLDMVKYTTLVCFCLFFLLLIFTFFFFFTLFLFIILIILLIFLKLLSSLKLSLLFVFLSVDAALFILIFEETVMRSSLHDSHVNSWQRFLVFLFVALLLLLITSFFSVFHFLAVRLYFLLFYFNFIVFVLFFVLFELLNILFMPEE